MQLTIDLFQKKAHSCQHPIQSTHKYHLFPWFYADMLNCEQWACELPIELDWVLSLGTMPRWALTVMCWYYFSFLSGINVSYKKAFISLCSSVLCFRLFSVMSLNGIFLLKDFLEMWSFKIFLNRFSIIKCFKQWV